VKRQTGTGDWDGDSSVDDYEFSWSMLDVEADTTQTQVTQRGGNIGGSVAWKLGVAAYDFDHVQGPVVMHNSVTTADNDDAIEWLTAQYKGTGQTTTVTVTDTSTYQLFSRKREEFDCKQSSMPLRTLDLEFRNASGVVIQPTSGLIELEISE
jgi:hypothetical protein